MFKLAISRRLNVLNLVSDKPTSKTWLPSLDGLRAIALLLVFLEHVTGNVFVEDASNDGSISTAFLNFGDAGMGRSGVYLFFVLSSFLLTSQLLRPGIRLKSFQLWINYVYKRLIRVYPLYVFVLVVYTIFSSFQYNIQDFFEHVTLQEAGNHFWTIPVEVKYYILLPSIALIITKLLRRRLSLVLIAFTGISIILKLFESSILSLDRLSLLPHLPIFFIGSIAALIHVDLFSKRDIGVKYKTWMEIVSILSILAILLSYKTAASSFLWNLIFGYEMPEIPSNHWLYILHGLLWSIFLISHLNGRGWIGGLLAWKPLRYIGVISFGMYLWHIAILGYLNAHLAVPSMIKFIAIFCVTSAVSTVTYIMIERPITKFKFPFNQKSYYLTR
ncbi:O-acetyltransferase OatA [Halomicronema hongdechloris C2206]|uniref:O-acetyltransferase OatA n=1 Tax=Halomicronema hongdechloris C2206 TaxID=1641165 RepID=A0A1Z3HJG5_9CYAN|nr:acyltransferase [Halomicronema hongdechloris]ASC70441.1 O-acetyltransferase OatA [Halomicronema hongdechloris C2206]